MERAFGDRRMFADSPTPRTIGLGLRVGDLPWRCYVRMFA
jgi:hypothetical protein